jgi:hypothetical protein
MRLFSYRDSSGKDGVGALFTGSSNTFTNISATDHSIPNSLQAIIESPED